MAEGRKEHSRKEGKKEGRKEGVKETGEEERRGRGGAGATWLSLSKPAARDTPMVFMKSPSPYRKAMAPMTPLIMEDTPQLYELLMSQ